jgi:hypothetical protein
VVGVAEADAAVGGALTDGDGLTDSDFDGVGELLGDLDGDGDGAGDFDRVRLGDGLIDRSWSPSCP